MSVIDIAFHLIYHDRQQVAQSNSFSLYALFKCSVIVWFHFYHSFMHFELVVVIVKLVCCAEFYMRVLLL